MVALFSVTMFADTYTVAGSSTDILGSPWDPQETANDMTLVSGSIYKLVKTDLNLAEDVDLLFKVCQNHGWATSYPGDNVEVTIPAGTKTLYFTFDASKGIAGVNCFYAVSVVGSSTVLFGAEWGNPQPANDMTMSAGLFTWTKEDVLLPAGDIYFKVAANHEWSQSWPSENYKLNIAEGGKYNVTITFDPYAKTVSAQADLQEEIVVLPSICLHANFNEGAWGDTENFEEAENKKTSSLTVNLEKGKYEFGVKIAGTQTANGVAFDRDNNSAAIVAGEETGNLSLDADTKGEYTFTWTYETNTLSIEFPEYVASLPVIKMKGAWDAWADPITLTPADNKETASAVLNFATTGKYEFKMIKDNAWKSKSNGGQPFGLHRGYPSVDGVDDDVKENLQIDVDKVGDYTFTWTFATNSVSIDFPELVSSTVTLAAIPTHVNLTIKDGETTVVSGSKVKELNVLNLTAVANDAAYKVASLRAYKTGEPGTEVAISDGELTMPGYGITIAAEEAPRAAVVRGLKSWEEEDALVMDFDAETKKASVSYEVPAAGDYEFKMQIDGEWRSNGATFTRAENSKSNINYDDYNGMNLHADKAGKYTLTWTYDGDKLEIAYPSESVSAVNLISSEHVTLTVNDGAIKEGDNVAEFTELAISAVPTSAAYKVTLSAYKTGEPETVVAINDGKIIMPGYPITIKATEAVRTVAFHSSLNWEEDVVLVVNTENGTASAKVELTAGDYEFKMIVDEAYLSLPGDEHGKYRFHRDWTTDSGLSTANAQNMILAADIDGEYTISWVFASNTIAFTFPELPAIKYYVVGDFTNDWNTPCEMSENEGVYSVSIALEEAEEPVEFQIISVQDPYKKWYGQQNAGYSMDENNCTGWELKEGGSNIGLIASKSGYYSFQYTPATKLISVVYPSGGSALDNTDAAVKAVKTLENGQLIIEKNGKRYDVFGNTVK